MLGPANYVTPIPDGLDSAAAAPLLCAGVTVYSALRKTNAESGNFVVIMGAGGGLGHLAVSTHIHTPLMFRDSYDHRSNTQPAASATASSASTTRRRKT